MENYEEKRYFDLGTILSIANGACYTTLDDVYEVLYYLTGNDTNNSKLQKIIEGMKDPKDEINKSQFRQILHDAQSHVLSLYPDLNGVHFVAGDLKAFIDEQKKVFGEKLPLKPMNTDSNVDLLAEHPKQR